MSLSTNDVAVGVFVRGLGNLKTQLMKAEAQVAGSGRDAAALLDARLPRHEMGDDVAGDAQHDLHSFGLAAQVHWAAEGARLAIARIVGARAAAVTSGEKSFLDLYEQIDATIAHLREVSAGDVEAGLSGQMVIEHGRGSVSVDGGRFLLAYAIPHFFYHLTTAYDILRSQGVQLTMSDFLGDWGT